MSSFYSKPADYGTYTQPINLELVNFVMQSKQQKYDYNLDKIQTKIKDELGGLDLERAQDKEYFLERAQSVLASTGDLSKLDWSKNGVTRQVDTQLNSIVDDRVLNDVISTRNYRSFQNQLREKQKKNDGSYDPTNVAYAMNKFNVNDWLQGDTEEVGAIQYQDYTDVGAELKDISENLNKYARVIKRQNPSGDGMYWVTEEGKQLSAQEVRTIAESQLTNKAKSQMQINGWANYDAGVRSNQEIIGDFKTFKDNKLANTDKTITELSAKIKNLEGTNSPELTRYTEQKTKYQEYRNQLNDRYDGWMQKESISNITTTMENERVLDQFGSTFAINDISSTMDANPYVLAQFKSRLQREVAAEKIALESQQKAKEAGEAAESQYQTVVPTYDRDGKEYTAVNRYKEVVTDVTNLQDSYKQTVNQVYNEVKRKDPEVAEALKVGYDPASGISEEAFMEHKMQQMGSESANFIKPVQLKALESARLRRDNAINIKNEAEDAAFDTLENSGGSKGGLDNIVEEYKDNTKIKVIDSSGDAISAADFLNRYGINSSEDLNNNPEVKEALLKSYYADKINNLSRRGIKQDPANMDPTLRREFERSRVQNLRFNPAGPLKDPSGRADQAQIDILKKRLIQKFGGDEKRANDFLQEAESKGVGKKVAELSDLSPLIGMPSVTDESVTEDNVLDAWVTPDSLSEAAGNILAETGQSTRKDAVVIRGKTTMAQNLTDIVRSPVAKISGGIQGKVKDGSSYTIEDVGDGTVNIFFEVDGKDGATIQQRASVPLTNLPSSITNEINFKEQTPLFTKETMQPVEGQVKFHSEVDMKAHRGTAEILGRSLEEVADNLSSEGIRTTNYTAFPEIMGTKKEPTEIGIAIDNMLNSKDLFTRIEEVEGEFMYKIEHRNPTTGVATALYSPKIEIPEDLLEQAYFNVKYAPQTYVANMIQRILVNTSQTGTDNPEASLEKILQIYGR